MLLRSGFRFIFFCGLEPREHAKHTGLRHLGFRDDVVRIFRLQRLQVRTKRRDGERRRSTAEATKPADHLRDALSILAIGSFSPNFLSLAASGAVRLCDGLGAVFCAWYENQSLASLSGVRSLIGVFVGQRR